MYDIFFLGNTGTAWDTLKAKYPNAQRLEKNTPISVIQKKSFTKFFWVVWHDLIIADDFNFDEYYLFHWDYWGKC